MNDQNDFKDGPSSKRDTKTSDAGKSRPVGGVCRPSTAKARGGDEEEATRDASSQPEPGPQSGHDESPDEVLARLEKMKRGEMTGGSSDLPMERWSEEQVPAKTRLRWKGPGTLVYDPALYQTGAERYAIEGKREEKGRTPWGFWGGLFFVALTVILLAGAQNIYSLWDMFLAMLGLTVGALLFRFGRKSTLVDVELCDIDGRQRVLRIPEGAQAGLDETHLAFDQIVETVFGMTKLPIDERTENVRVDAFALLVRTSDDELVPIVEGSPYKDEVHELAKFMSSITESKLTYVGRGIRS